METTVKLYSLNYSNVKTYLATSLFIVGNILFPALFSSHSTRWINLAAYLFLHSDRCLQIWLEGRFANCYLVSSHKFFALWYASARSIACHSIEIRIISYRRRMGCATLRTHFYPCISRSSLVLSDHRHIGRVDVYRKFLQSCSGFPHRYSRNVPASIRRLFVY